MRRRFQDSSFDRQRKAGISTPLAADCRSVVNPGTAGATRLVDLVRLLGVIVSLGTVAAVVEASESLPAYLIRLPESVPTVFVAETRTAEFHRFENLASGTMVYRGASYMSIGQYGDGKRYSGDRRTPLGIYFVTEQLDTSRMHEKYGVTAFPIDYPNALDRRSKKTGDGIWVHGVDPRGGKRPPRDTDGCIALPNDRLAALESQFVANSTPVIITKALDWVRQEEIEAIGRALEAAVSRWAVSLERRDIDAYLSLYDDEFRHWGLDKQQWSALRAQTLGKRNIKRVVPGDLLLLADPVETDTYLSRFRLSIDDDAASVELTKRLYWRRDAGGVLRIIAEDSG